MKRNQKGFTLIELMVAMLLGLILTLAALQLFMTNQRTFSLQQALAELHQDGQMAIRYMVADIRQAGRGNAVAGSIPAIVLGEGGSADDSNDSLAIRHWSTSTCAGEAYPDQTEVISVYGVSDGVLQCSNGLTGLTVDLLSGVDSFQVLYGVDGTKNGELGVTQFITADKLTADSVVVAVRFALLLSSDKYRQAQSINSAHWVLDKEVSKNDSRLRRTFTSTVQLRNYDWDAI